MVEDFCFFLTFLFEAARKVEMFPEGQPSRGLHGHSFLVKARAFLPQNWAPFPGSGARKLEQALTSCIAPIKYSNLNIHLPVPTDKILARWIQSNADILGIKTVEIQSTLKLSADLEKTSCAYLERFRFEPAYQLLKV